MNSVGSRLIVAFWLWSIAGNCVAQTQGVLLDSLKLRKTPSLKGMQIGTLKVHAKVTILDPTPTNGFYHVRISRNREGWIRAKGVKLITGKSAVKPLVRRPQSREVEPHKAGPTAAAAAVCALDLASCAAYGCADFSNLQQQADNLVGEDKELSAQERAKLKGLNASRGQVSEGDLVSLLGIWLVHLIRTRASRSTAI